MKSYFSVMSQSIVTTHYISCETFILELFCFTPYFRRRHHRRKLPSCGRVAHGGRVPEATDASQGPVLCRPSNNVPTSYKNMSNIACGPAQDRPLRSADLAGSYYYFMHLGAIYILCASAQFYALAIFVIDRLLPR